MLLPGVVGEGAVGRLHQDVLQVGRDFLGPTKDRNVGGIEGAVSPGVLAVLGRVALGAPG